jgi:hypothetical protein
VTKPYFLKIIWLIGFIILVVGSSDFKNHIQQTGKETFNMIPVLWSIPFISIVVGCYISILFVKRWTFKLNLPLLLCVSLPCILLAFAYSILATFTSFGSVPILVVSSNLSFLLVKIFSADVVGIVAGLTLILSILNGKSEN